jgi:hypothetical protein
MLFPEAPIESRGHLRTLEMSEVASKPPVVPQFKHPWKPSMLWDIGLGKQLGASLPGKPVE